MLDRDTASEGFLETCLYCGRQIAGSGVIYHVPEFQGGVMVRFCSKECAKAYRSLVDEYWEEFEEIDSAGAT